MVLRIFVFVQFVHDDRARVLDGGERFEHQAE